MTPETLQKYVDNTNYTSNKKNFVTRLYWNLVADGFKPVVQNYRYLIFDETYFEFIHSARKMSYTAKSF